GQFHVEHEAGGNVRLFGVDIIAGRSEDDVIDVVRSQQFLKRLLDADIVVDDEYDVVGCSHGFASGSIGKVKTNFAPFGSLFSVQSRPPCDSTMERQIASPMPIPSPFVVKNGSNILSGNSTPGPWSPISTRTIPSARRACTLTTLGPAEEFIASTPLRIRLTRTCWIWTRSSRIDGRPLSASISMRTPRRDASSAKTSRASAMTLVSEAPVRASTDCLNRARMRF